MEKGDNFDMGMNSSFRSSHRGKKTRPIPPPAVVVSEIRYSEVELSLYSEFSEDEDYDSTNNTLNKDSMMNEKNMFNK